MTDVSRTVVTSRRPLRHMLEDVVSTTRFWWLFLITGVAWMVVSITILRFDYTTVAAIAVLFGLFCLTAAVNEIMVGAVLSSWGWRLLHFLLAIVFAVVGVVAFTNFGATFITLAAIIGFYLTFRGAFDLAMALAYSRSPGWWVMVIVGLIEIGLGFWAAGSWSLSVVLLVAWVAAAAMVHGIGEIAVVFQLRKVGGGAAAVKKLDDRLTLIDSRPAAAAGSHS